MINRLVSEKPAGAASRGNPSLLQVGWAGCGSSQVCRWPNGYQLLGVSLRCAAGRAVVLRIEPRCASLAPSGFHPSLPPVG